MKYKTEPFSAPNKMQLALHPNPETKSKIKTEQGTYMEKRKKETPREKSNLAESINIK